MEHFAVLSNTVPCKKETNMVVANTMTYKLALIWRHMKTLYSQVQILKKGLLVRQS